MKSLLKIGLLAMLVGTCIGMPSTTQAFECTMPEEVSIYAKYEQGALTDWFIAGSKLSGRGCSTIPYMVEKESSPFTGEQLAVALSTMAESNKLVLRDGVFRADVDYLCPTLLREGRGCGDARMFEKKTDDPSSFEVVKNGLKEDVAKKVRISVVLEWAQILIPIAVASAVVLIPWIVAFARSRRTVLVFGIAVTLHVVLIPIIYSLNFYDYSNVSESASTVSLILVASLVLQILFLMCVGVRKIWSLRK